MHMHTMAFLTSVRRSGRSDMHIPLDIKYTASNAATAIPLTAAANATAGATMAAATIAHDDHPQRTRSTVGVRRNISLALQTIATTHCTMNRILTATSTSHLAANSSHVSATDRHSAHPSMFAQAIPIAMRPAHKVNRRPKAAQCSSAAAST